MQQKKYRKVGKVIVFCGVHIFISSKGELRRRLGIKGIKEVEELRKIWKLEKAETINFGR